MPDRITPPESFSTARLVLRKPRETDAPLIFEAYGQDPEVTRYLLWRPHRSLKDAEEAVGRFLANWRAGSKYCWLIFRRDRGELAGAIAARIDGQGVHLGYLLAQSFRGEGLMSEAVNAVVEWAFSEASIYRVWAVCDVENMSSARLLDRNGFQREGILRKWSLHPNLSSTPRDCYCYARTREE
jgi:ribosomal-protein-alanine N-acetyltransferase